MIIRRGTVAPFTFGQLKIRDYTSGQDLTASLATIEVPPGAQHPLAYSTKCDKYYFVLAGRIHFTGKDGDCTLDNGDCCVIPRNETFGYSNPFEEPATLLLFHAPMFDLNAEVFLT